MLGNRALTCLGAGVGRLSPASRPSPGHGCTARGADLCTCCPPAGTPPGACLPQGFPKTSHLPGAPPSSQRPRPGSPTPLRFRPRRWAPSCTPMAPSELCTPVGSPLPTCLDFQTLCPGLRLTTYKGVGLTQNEVSTSKPRDPSVSPRQALEAIQRQRTRAQKPSCPSRSTMRGARGLGTVPETSSLGKDLGPVHGAPGCTRQPGGPAGQPRCSAHAGLLFGSSRWTQSWGSQRARRASPAPTPPLPAAPSSPPRGRSSLSG